ASTTVGNHRRPAVDRGYRGAGMANTIAQCRLPLGDCHLAGHGREESTQRSSTHERGRRARRTAEISRGDRRVRSSDGGEKGRSLDLFLSVKSASGSRREGKRREPTRRRGG